MNQPLGRVHYDAKSWNNSWRRGLNNCQYIFYIQYVTHYNINPLHAGGEYLTKSLEKQTN